MSKGSGCCYVLVVLLVLATVPPPTTPTPSSEVVIDLEAKTEAFLDAVTETDQGATATFGNLFDDSPPTKGLVHLRLLQFPDAKESLLLALKEARSDSAENVSSQHLSDVLSSLAYVHVVLGENSRALELRKERLELVRHNVGRDNKKALTECLLSIGYSYIEMKKSEEAIRTLEEALSYVKVRDIQTKADILGALGQAYYSNDDYLKAVEYFSEVKVIAERLRRKTPDNMLLPDVLVNMAAVFGSQAKPEDGIKSYEEAICM
ncbi:Hypp4676 [Branchiostoma lanceolatum]|uniref:Hypp4676 protein n=1 Tax=Branchiostoma lanceolatum TaxID=7740 RepID=A0A8K0EWK8_BRALA|nr:Hypp4676 [Branchiostoma lanceolatum]